MESPELFAALEILSDADEATTSLLKEVIKIVPGFWTNASHTLKEKISLRYLEECSGFDYKALVVDGSGSINVNRSVEEVLLKVLVGGGEAWIDYDLEDPVDAGCSNGDHSQVTRLEGVEKVGGGFTRHDIHQYILQKRATLPKYSLDLDNCQVNERPSETISSQPTVQSEKADEVQPRVQPDNANEVQPGELSDKANGVQPIEPPDKANGVQAIEQPGRANEVQHIEQPDNAIEVQHIEQPDNAIEVQHSEQPDKAVEVPPIEQPGRANEVQHIEQPDKGDEALPIEQPVRANEVQPVEQPKKTKNCLSVEGVSKSSKCHPTEGSRKRKMRNALTTPEINESSVGSVIQSKRRFDHKNSLDRRTRLAWTTKEEEKLKEIMQRLDGSQGYSWIEILKLGSGVFDNSRKPSDLKTKWRNIQNKEQA